MYLQSLPSVPRRWFYFCLFVVDRYSPLWDYVVGMFCCALLCVHSSFAIISTGGERAGCFALFVSLESRDCCVALPHDVKSLFALCDSGIS